MWIEIEGVSSSGKSTFIEHAKRQLPDVAVVKAGHTKNPLAHQAMTTLSSIYSPRVSCLAFAAHHAYNFDVYIEPALDNGQTVFTDRGILSTLVYQGSRMEQDAWSVLKVAYPRMPDLFVLMDAPVEIIMSRRFDQQRPDALWYANKEIIHEWQLRYRTHLHELEEAGLRTLILQSTQEPVALFSKFKETLDAMSP